MSILFGGRGRIRAYPASQTTTTGGGGGGGGGGTPSGMFMYSNPIAPSFARWSPELYAKLDNNITDSSPNAYALATYGPTPPTFAVDSPFGAGSCLQINPGAAAFDSGISIPTNRKMQMSRGSETDGVPWSMGFWFKAVAPSTSGFSIFQTVTPYAVGGKVLYVDGAGVLRYNSFASVDVLLTPNICDGAWHSIVLDYWLNYFGFINTYGDFYLDGVRLSQVGFASAAPPTSVKLLGQNDNVGTYLLSDFWYQNAPVTNDLPAILWNAGAGRRFDDPATGLIELAKV